MVSNGGCTYVQNPRNFFCGIPFPEQVKDLPFSWTQSKALTDQWGVPFGSMLQRFLSLLHRLFPIPS
jgi:hypothetical protein